MSIQHAAFFADLKAGALAPCYVLEGAEEFTKEAALAALRKKLLPDGWEAMNESRLVDPDAGALIAAAETLPLMADRRLVLARESGMLSGKAGAYDEAKSAERLAEYFKSPSPLSVVVFYVRGRADKRKRLYKALDKEPNARVVSFEELSQPELEKWIAQSLKKRGKRVTQEGCQALIFASGRELSTLDGEIDKLAAYAKDSEVVTPEDIAAICAKTTEYQVYDLARVLLSGDGERTMDMARGLMLGGEDQLYLLALLQRQCKQLWYLAPMLARRASDYDAASRLGIPPRAVGELRPIAAKLPADAFLRMANLCTETEFMFKSGRISQDGALISVMLALLAEVKGAC